MNRILDFEIDIEKIENKINELDKKKSNYKLEKESLVDQKKKFT